MSSKLGWTTFAIVARSLSFRHASARGDGRGDVIVILLCGGDKDSQDRDIKRALEIAKEV